jgi:sarcosine oxidase gamma subunit
MPDLIPVRPGCPGGRLLAATSAITIRHFPGDASARHAVQQAGLAWCETPGTFTGTGPWLAWRSPQEAIAIGCEPARLRTLLAALAPGRNAGAAAVDISEAIGGVELHGPMLDEWLAHLVDATAIPRQAGRVTRARLADVAVMLLRLAPERLWLLAEKPLLPYVQEWLAYAHEGAFADLGASVPAPIVVAPAAADADTAGAHAGGGVPAAGAVNRAAAASASSSGLR